jgi:adenylate cyclase
MATASDTEFLAKAPSEAHQRLAEMRHSLRTPLNQIIGYAEMLQEEIGDTAARDLLPDLEKIHTAGGQLLALFNDGFAPWKLETGRIDLESMRLEMRTPLNLIIGYSELCQELAEETSQPQRLIADLQKITGAARNLLTLFESTSFPTHLIIPVKPGVSAEATIGKGTTDGDGRETAAAPQREQGAILIVDDNEMNRDMLYRRLERHGYTVTEAESAAEAFERLRQKKFDLVLLDVLMPGINGDEALRKLQADVELRHIPVIMLSALDELEMAVKCIEAGAEDYIPKPFNPVLLYARIKGSLEKKRLRDQERAHLEQIRIEREKSERMILNILPPSIATRLREGESIIADHFPEATVLFADMENFTGISSHMTPAEIVDLLNEMFSRFDWLAELHNLEKIKTIGDAYMAAAGVPTPRPDHAIAVAEMALEMQRVLQRVVFRNGLRIRARIGINSGSVAAGVIGRRKFIYDMWGDTVNLASRMQYLAEPGSILVAQPAYDQLRDKYLFDPGAEIEVKGRGKLRTYMLTGRKTLTMP